MQKKLEVECNGRSKNPNDDYHTPSNLDNRALPIKKYAEAISKSSGRIPFYK